jgi:hypothetical protein
LAPSDAVAPGNPPLGVEPRTVRLSGSAVRVAALAVGALIALAGPPATAAALADERALAERYAPVVRLVEQTEECGHGEPYRPMDVDRLFGQSTVALRGPWNAFDLVRIGPVADDLAGLYEYHLDFPGNALEPGCAYELWARRLTDEAPAIVYAHVATQDDRPGELALQYWFFYPFNDFNNTHEGDWEMIQLLFAAGDAAEAISRPPVAVGYSSHEGAERADWGDEKLELVDGTHPVVYPAAGSHANKFTAALYLGSSAEAGVGCDDTLGPHIELTPDVKTIPSDATEAVGAFPWISFEGRWGELQKAFFNGPTGPNLKTQWTAPMDWADGWRDTSYAVPTGGLFGTGATDFFCSGVARGSAALARLLRDPVPLLITLAVAVGLLVLVIVRATWTPVAPLRLARRRTWGQILSASGRMYVGRLPLFLGVGLILIPVTLVITVLQRLVLWGVDLVGATTGQAAGVFAYLALVIAASLTLLGFGLVQAATTCALLEIDAGRPIDALGAYRAALPRFRPLLTALVIFVAAWIALTTTAILLPVALWLAVRWCLVAQAVEVEARDASSALRRSGELVRRRWFRVGSLVGLGGVLALAAGPLLGALLIFVSNSSLAVLNLLAGVVYAVALPFVALVTSYVYFDARARSELEPRDEPRELPAEIQLS